MISMRLTSFGVIFIFSIFIYAITLIVPEQAYAGYLDPGSGSTLVQGIIATIAALKRWWNKLFSIFSSRNNNDRN